MDQAPEAVKPPWDTLVLVCEKCDGARHGPDARAIRKGLKHRLGKRSELRVMEAPCMSVCPDGAVTVCIARGSRPVELKLVRAESELDDLASELSQR